MSSLRVPITDTDHLLGNQQADCVLVEYGDYECPHCRAAHSYLGRIQRHFGDRLLYVFRNFPLGNIHPYAEAAAEAAEFAADHDKFWEMHDLLFQYQDQLGVSLLKALVQQIGLSPDELESSLEQGTYKKKVQADFSGGVRSGVNGTPTFFINGTRYNGPNEYEYLVEAISEVIE